MFSNNNFQFLNNITRIFTYFFTHTYFYTCFKQQILAFKCIYQTTPKHAFGLGLCECLDLRFLPLHFYFSASCTVHRAWIVHLGLWKVTCIVHALRLHCAGDIVHALFTSPKTTLFKKNIKNGSHSTIYTFKNYFATVFSVFSKISCIQTDAINENYFTVQLIFATIHGSHCTFWHYLWAPLYYFN